VLVAEGKGAAAAEPVRGPSQADLQLQDRDRLRVMDLAGTANQAAVLQKGRFLEALLDPAEQGGAVDVGEKRQTGPVERSAQVHADVRAGAEEGVADPLLEEQAQGARV